MICTKICSARATVGMRSRSHCASVRGPHSSSCRHRVHTWEDSSLSSSSPALAWVMSSGRRSTEESDPSEQFELQEPSYNHSNVNTHCLSIPQIYATCENYTQTQWFSNTRDFVREESGERFYKHYELYSNLTASCKYYWRVHIITKIDLSPTFVDSLPARRGPGG